MSIKSQQYAYLADDSYNAHTNRDKIEFEGVEYIILEYVDNKINGYQGTIYQSVDTHEIVVAHRGTEFKSDLKAALQDGGLADGGMVLARTNAQAKDAIELTKRALEHAERLAPKYGDHAPPVTVTGHSLGGCLAQVVAHKFDLKGETFNAYGAVSLDQRIPEGGNNLINHVMAADPVSAAGRHFGQVRVHATREEIYELQHAGYDNNRNPVQPRNLPRAVAKSLDSHYMDNFLNVDSDNKPDRSVLADASAHQLAVEFDPAIDRYRSDIALARGAITFVVRDPLGRIQDGLDALRDPLPPGELIRQQQRAASAMTWQEARGVASSNHPLPAHELPYVPESIMPGGMISLPGYLPAPDDRQHPPLKRVEETSPLQGMPQSSISSDHSDYALYVELKQKVPTGTSEDRLLQITVAAKMGGVRAGQVEHFHVGENPLQAIVSGRVPGDWGRVDLAIPPPSVQETLRQSEIFDRQQAQQVAQFQAQQQDLHTHGQSRSGMSAG